MSTESREVYSLFVYKPSNSHSDMQGNDTNGYRLNAEYDAYLCGIMIGDGCLCLYKPKTSGPKYTIDIALNRISDRLFCFGFVLPLLTRFTDKRVRVKDRPTQGKLEIVVYSKHLFSYMNRKWNFPIGKKKQLMIPEYIVSDDRRLVKTIAGIFATDGTVVFSKQHKDVPYYPRFEFCSISEPLLDQLADYFRRKKYHHSRWKNRLAINGFEGTNRFIKEIGLINPAQLGKWAGNSF